MAQKRRETRQQKQSKGIQAGKSRYALKIERRKKLAKAEGMSADTPIPVLKSGEIVEASYGDDTQETKAQANAFEYYTEELIANEIKAEIAELRVTNS